MTYASFLLFFLVLPSVGLVFLGFRKTKNMPSARQSLRHHWVGIAILAVIAFVWTTPWDNFLIAKGVWASPADRVIGTLGYVPLEEYAFFLLMPIFNGSLCFLLLDPRRSIRGGRVSPAGHARLAVTLVALILLLAGLMLFQTEPGFYLGSILLWFTPPLLIQWLYDPVALGRHAGLVALATLLPTAYFAVADSFAIADGIWTIAERTSTGIGIAVLPVEELIFFFVTSLLLAQGLVLWHSLDRRTR